MSPIEFYDTRTRSRRVFEPLEPGRVGMYSCGPTVYAPPHIGNLRSRLFSDLLKRFLLAEGLAVTHVINITDVGHLVSDADEGEDKIEAAARREGKTAEEIAEHFTQVWRDDGAAVHCLPPEHNPKATEHIPEIHELIERLVQKDVAYAAGGDVYFRVKKFAEYGKLSKRKVDDPSVVERFELFALGYEIANAYSELNDPVDQRDRMMEQASKKAEGDEEAEIADEDFLVAIEHGMPPAGGLGIGVDRVVQLMTGEHSLREVILFPTMRERQAERHELSDEDDGAS